MWDKLTPFIPRVPGAFTVARRQVKAIEATLFFSPFRDMGNCSLLCNSNI